MKDKWHIHELHSILVQEETILKNLGSHSFHYVRNQRVGKKVVKKHGKGKGPLNIDESSTKSRRKMTNVLSMGSLDISKRIA